MRAGNRSIGKCSDRTCSISIASRFLVCNNTVYAKQLEILKDVLAEAEKGFPYQGAKEHYIVDVEDRDLLEQVIALSEPLIPIPVKRSRKKKQG